MIQKFKAAIICMLILCLLALIIVYYEKDSPFFPEGPPVGYTLLFNGFYFFAVFSSLWLLFEHTRQKDIFFMLSAYGTAGILIPSQPCNYLAMILLATAFLIFLMQQVKRHTGSADNAGVVDR